MSPARHRPVFTTAALVLIFALGAGCGSKHARHREQVRQYVGSASTSPTLVGIVHRRDGAIRAYVCDGKRIGEWFTGSLKRLSFDLSSVNGGRLQGSFADKRGSSASGTFASPDGRRLHFAVKPATGKAGVYRAEGIVKGNNYLAGWVVLRDGRQTGSEQIGTTRRLIPVPRLDPSASTIKLASGGVSQVRTSAAITSLPSLPKGTGVATPF